MLQNTRLLLTNHSALFWSRIVLMTLGQIIDLQLKVTHVEKLEQSA